MAHMNRTGSVTKWKIKPISFPEREVYLLDYALAQAQADRRNFSNWVVGLILAHYQQHAGEEGPAANRVGTAASGQPAAVEEVVEATKRDYADNQQDMGSKSKPKSRS